jgi:hypothetical protein
VRAVLTLHRPRSANVFSFFTARSQALRAPNAATLVAHAKRAVGAKVAAACGFVPGLIIGITR